MFVQIIEGRTSKPEEVKALGDRWEEELRPGATGFLGVTAGVTPDGRAITIVRFDSPDSAQANANRPEQTAFFGEMSALFDGDPTFAESTDTEQYLGGIDTTAGFVQVMKSQGVDRVRMKELDKQMERLGEHRPDLRGTFRVWTGPDSCYEIAYFSNEAEARANEAKDMPPDVQAVMAEFGDLMANTEFLDLPDPQIR
jgi:hypothetical protein